MHGHTVSLRPNCFILCWFSNICGPGVIFSLIWCSVVYSCMMYYGTITSLFALGDFRHVLCWVYTKPTTSLMVISGPVSSSNPRKVARHRVKVNKLLLLLPPLPELPSSAPTRAFRARSRRQTRRDPRQVH